jgi:hypothetical protein
MLGIREVEPCAGIPRGSLVVRGDPAGVFEDAREVQQVQVMNVVLGLVKSLSGPPSQIGVSSTRMSAAMTFSKIGGQSSWSHPCSVMSGHKPVAIA